MSGPTPDETEAALAKLNAARQLVAESPLLSASDRQAILAPLDEAIRIETRILKATRQAEAPVAWIGLTPDRCDLCGTRLIESFVDGKTRMGPWACMCGACHAGHGIGFGTGRGQGYTKDDAGRWLKTGG